MTEPRTAARPREGSVADSRPSRWWRAASHPLCFVAVIAAMALTPVAGALMKPAPVAPKVFFQLPTFTMTDEHGRPFGSADLAGKVWVASFAFTSCPSVCPRLMEKMFKLQHRTRAAASSVKLVTFTVDPETDTPERLRAYARRFRASPARWSFLGGDLKVIEATVVKGFKLAMGKQPVEGEPSLFSIFHSERFALVDRQGRIRGYYEATDQGIDQLLRDIGLVLNLG